MMEDSIPCPCKLVVIGLGERLHGEFAGAVETETGKDDATGAAADVEEEAVALLAHEGKDSAIDAYGAEEVGVHDFLGLSVVAASSRPTMA